jgi:hypothetical protein
LMMSRSSHDDAGAVVFVGSGVRRRGGKSGWDAQEVSLLSF